MNYTKLPVVWPNLNFKGYIVWYHITHDDHYVHCTGHYWKIIEKKKNMLPSTDLSACDL